MREINVSEVTSTVAKLCMDSCYYLPEAVKAKIRAAAETEESPLGKEILNTLIENFELSQKKAVPLCQDTGLTVVFLEIGQEVHFVGGDLYEAIHAGVSKGYVDGYLRKSSVGDPVFDRKNSGDNTPAIIHTKIVPGDKVKMVVCPKGCGGRSCRRRQAREIRRSRRGSHRYRLPSRRRGSGRGSSLRVFPARACRRRIRRADRRRRWQTDGYPCSEAG